MNTKAPECWSLDPQVRGLHVEPSRGHSFVLPFAHFVYSEFQSEEPCEVLKLVFTTHEVEVRGHNLRRLETALQREELASVRVVPEKFRPLAADNQPLVIKLTVSRAEDAETETLQR